MTATDWRDYAPLFADDTPAVHPRFAHMAPPTVGLRLFARVHGRYMAAQILGQTLCVGSQPASKSDDVVIEFDDASQLEDAMRLLYWLKNAGWLRVYQIRNPVTDRLYCTHGGEA